MTVSEAWLRIVTIAFAAWAGVVGWAANRVMASLDHMAQMQETLSISNERRISTLEESLRVHLADDAKKHAEQQALMQSEIDSIERRLK